MPLIKTLKTNKKRTLIVLFFLILCSAFYYQHQRQKTASHLASKATTAFANENHRLALRLAQEAVLFDSKNAEGQGLLDTLPFYLASIFKNPVYNPDTSLFPINDKFFWFFSDVIEKDNSATLNMINLENLCNNIFTNTLYKSKNNSQFSKSNLFYSNSQYSQLSPDRKYLFFYTDVIDRNGTLHLLNLQNMEDEVFPNTYIYDWNIKKNESFHSLSLRQWHHKEYNSRFRYSPNQRYLEFYTGISDTEEKKNGTFHLLNLQTLEDKTFQNAYYPDQYENRYSKDSTYLTFYTDIEKTNGTLHLLNLKTLEEKTFPNSDSQQKYNQYSPNSKYFVFQANKKANKGMLHILKLETLEDKTFPNNENHYMFYTDNKYLTFYSDIKNDTGTFHVLNLETLEDKSFPNSNVQDKSPRVHNNHLLFSTDPKDDISTFHVLNLETLKDKSFPNSNVQNHSPRVHNNYLLFSTDLKDDMATLHVLNLETLKEKKFPNSNTHRLFSNIRDNHLLFSTNLKDDIGTLHVLNLETLKDKSFPNHKKADLGRNQDYEYSKHHIEFYTEQNGGIGTFHLLNLKTLTIKTFPNSKINRFHYSPDRKYLAFYTGIKENKGKLHILNVQTLQDKTFSNVYYKDYGCLQSPPGYFSKDSKYAVFYSQIKEDKEQLNVLNLRTSQAKAVHNSNCRFYTYSSDSKILRLYSSQKNKDNNKDTLLLNLKTLKLKPPSLFNTDIGFPKDKYSVFFTDRKTDEKGDFGTLHILNKQSLEDKIFPNAFCYYSERFSTKSHFIFITDIKNNIGTLHVLNKQTLEDEIFPKVFRDWANFSSSYSYSRNEKYLEFYTDMNQNTLIGTFHLLNLETLEDKNFPNIVYYSSRNSSDSTYLAFKTKLKGKETLQLLNLKTLEDTIQLLNLETSQDTILPDSYIMHSFSTDGKHLIFDVIESKGKQHQKITKSSLHVVNLQTLQTKMLRNYRYSGTGTIGRYNKYRISTRYIKDSDHHFELLNLQTLEIKIFPNIFRYKIFPDTEKLILFNQEETMLCVFNMETMEEIGRIQHQTKIQDWQLSKNSRYLLTTSESIKGEGILKISNLGLEENRLEYYDKIYTPLTAEEKLKYSSE